jgi:hypothetical protein
MKIKTSSIILAGLLAIGSIQHCQAQRAKPNQVAQCGVAIVVVAGGIYIYIKLEQLCKKVLPPLTNAPAPPIIKTNAPSKGAIVKSAISLTIKDDVASYSDISAMGYTDPAGNLYRVFFRVTLQESDDCSTWRDTVPMTGYVSARYVVLSDGSWCGMGGTEPTITLTLGGGAAAQKFYRLKSN